MCLSDSAVGLYDPATGELRKRLTVGSLRDIGDPELRTVLESLARSLGEQEGKE